MIFPPIGIKCTTNVQQAELWLWCVNKKAVKPTINRSTMQQIKHNMMTAAGIKANHCGVNSEGLILFFHSLTSWRNYPGGCFKEDVLADMWYRFALSLVCQWSESLFNFLSNTQKLPLHRTRNVRMLKDESSTVGYYPPRCAGLHTHPRWDVYWWDASSG